MLVIDCSGTMADQIGGVGTNKLAAAKAAAEQEKKRALAQQEKEAIDLAFSLTEKVLGEKMNKEQDKKIIERLAKDLG